MPRVIKHPDVRRAETLDRAVALFVQRGYDNVSLNDLIADAGASKGAFYHWFPSKDALMNPLLWGKPVMTARIVVDHPIDIFQ